MTRSTHLAALLSLLFLVGCGTTHVAREGKYPVKGICRSCQPHMIKGVWYTPQLYYDYDETGIASWYGPGFHNKQKACGEVFDQHDISAAHKTLPLPTVVRVTNKENGKSIVLLVDDRGPYVDDRIIDLSIGAAKAVGSYAKGLAKVRVQSLPGHSHALSIYLARNGNRWGVDKRGRTWREVYLEEIAGKYPEDLSDFDDGNTRTKTPVHGYGHNEHLKEEVIPIHVKGGTSVDDLINDSVLKDSSSVTKIAGKKVAATVTQAIANTGKGAKPLGKSIAGAGGYYIHLSSFVNKANALKHAQEVSSITGNVAVKESNISGQIFHVVRCGPYPSEAAAKMAMTSLDALGHNPQLIKE